MPGIDRIDEEAAQSVVVEAPHRKRHVQQLIAADVEDVRTGGCHPVEEGGAEHVPRCGAERKAEDVNVCKRCRLEGDLWEGAVE